MRLFTSKEGEFFSKTLSGFLAFIIVANSFLFALVLTPQEADAQFTDPVNAAIQPVQLSLQITQTSVQTAAEARNTATQTLEAQKSIWDQFMKWDGVVAEITKSLLLLMMHQVLAKITNDTIAWINGGGKGQIRVLQDPGKFLRDAVDEAGGVLAGEILGVSPQSLCNADYLKYTLRAELTGPYAVPTFNEKVQCTFSGAANGLQKFQQDFRNGGWTAFVQLLDKPNNPIGLRLLATDELAKQQASQANKAQAELATMSSGYLNQEKCIITKLGEDFGTLHGNEMGKDLVDVMGAWGYDGDLAGFKSYYRANGGDFSCKTVTPAENIKEIASSAITLPTTQLQGMINSFTTTLGTGAGSVITPYLTAIGNATLNLLLNKEKGLITSFLAPQTKPRQVRRQITNTLQNNARMTQSTGTLISSANDFRSFLLSAALEFSQFVTTTGKVISAEQILGYQAINRYNFNASGGNWDGLAFRHPGTEAYGIGPGNPGNTDTIVPANSTINNPSTDPSGGNGTGGDDIASVNFFTQQAGRVFTEEADWCGAYSEISSTQTAPPVITAVNAMGGTPVPLANFGGISTTYKWPNTTNYQGSPSDYYVLPVGYTQPPVPSSVNTAKLCTGACTYTTFSSGNIVYTIPSTLQYATALLSNGTTALHVYGTSSYNYLTKAYYPEYAITDNTTFLNTCGSIRYHGNAPTSCADPYWISYNIGGTPMSTRIVAFDDNQNGKADRFVRQSIVGANAGTLNENNINFSETIIDTGRDTNQDGATDSIMLNSTGLPAGQDLQNLFEIIPNYQGRAQTAAAGANGGTAYVFGGYDYLGFSAGVLNNSGALVSSQLPSRAGAAAVYYPPNGRVYLFGGFDNAGLKDSVLEFNPSNGQFRTMSAHLPSPGMGFSAAYYPSNQRIYLFGGINAGDVSDQILEYNQTTDTLVRKGTLPTTLAYSAAALASYNNASYIEVVGGEQQSGAPTGSIYEYNPASNAIASKSTGITPAAYVTAVSTSPVSNIIHIYGGQGMSGYITQSWTYNAQADSRTALAAAAAAPANTSKSSAAAASGGDRVFEGVSAWDPAVNPLSVKIYPQGDLYLIPGGYYDPVHPAVPAGMSVSDAAAYTASIQDPLNWGVHAISTTETIYQKYRSPSLDKASAFVVNHRKAVDYADPTATVVDKMVLRETNKNPNETFLASPFYPELYEKAQELMERIRIIKGYSFEKYNKCLAASGKSYEDGYRAGLAKQVGALPDDNPADNNANSENEIYYGNIANNSQIGPSMCEKYRGSVSDVLTRYSDISKIYQTLFAGIHDENSLESVDKDLKILSPEETNIRMALIGKRCPVVPPTATSSPDLVANCPVLSSGEYNMSHRFIFQPDDTSANPIGLTTGFATNPFNGKKSSSLAGVLNLEEMTTQLQTLPPDKNIIKLIRLRQILEQLQVSPQPISVPGKVNSTVNPAALSGVDIIQVSLPGYEKIQDWLNATSTDSGLLAKNQDIQSLIDAYGYSTAKEAYPQISKELDDIFPTIANQVADKMKEVFLKRMELQLEEAQADAQNRLEKFIMYARDLNPIVKLEAKDKPGLNLYNALGKYVTQIDFGDYVLQIDATNAFRNPQIIDGILAKLTPDQRDGIIGSAIYKIKTMAKFVGIDINSQTFTSQLEQYTLVPQNPSPTDVQDRVKKALKDVTMMYTGIFNQTDPSLTPLEKKLVPSLAMDSTTKTNTTGIGCGFSDLDGYFCNLTTSTSVIPPIQGRVYKDARSHLEDLANNFDAMVDEVSKIKQEFQDMSTNIKTTGQKTEDMLKLLSAMKTDYNQANACFGLQNPASARWKPSSDQMMLYGGIIGGIALIGLNQIFGGAIFNAVASFFGFGDNNDEAEAAAQQFRNQVTNCKNGMINYNKHVGQLADQFLCGKTNSKYQD